MYFLELDPHLFPAFAKPLNQHDRASLVRTCRALHVITDVLYSEVILRDGTGQATSFLRTIKAEPSRALRTKFIKFDYNDNCADTDATKILPLLPNLQHLEIRCRTSRAEGMLDPSFMIGYSSPNDGLRAVLAESALNDNVMTGLRTCSLEYCGSEAWDLGHLSIILFHPHLQRFRAHSSAGFYDNHKETPMISRLSQTLCTDLQILEFSYCDLTGSELCRILRIPKALKKFDLTYMQTEESFLERGHLLFQKCVDALEHQAASLEHISLIGVEGELEGPDDAFALFSKLRTIYTDVDIVSRVTDDENKFEDDMPPRHELSFRRLPKGLENLYLNVGNVAESYFNQHYNIINVFRNILPKLVNLEITVNGNSTDWKLIDGRLPMAGADQDFHLLPEDSRRLVRRVPTVLLTDD